MRYVLVAITLLFVGPVAAASPDVDPVLPAWMAGCWEMRQGEHWAEECWTLPRAGTMIGSGRRGAGERLGEWEVMRIALDEPNEGAPNIRMAFAASPGGRDWTLFGWSPTDAEGVVFFNVANDYPQRVHYWREGKKLRARISMADGSRPQEWEYAPMGAK